MISHRRRDFAAGNHFSFSHLPRAAGAADAMGEYNAWAERIKGANHGYFARSPDPNPGAWARRPDQVRRAVAATNPPTTGLGGGDPIRSAAAAEEQGFRWAAKESYDSDTPSPPLWKSPPIARSAGSSPIRSVYRDDDGDDDGDDRGRHPNQRVQAIERYRQEMMEMVRGLPEAAYELSLRDIVESPSPRIARIEGQRPTDEAESPKEKSEKGASRSEKETKKEKNKKKKKVRRISRSESLDTGGLLIKMFMPLSVGGRRKSFGASSAGTGAKVSPKPTAAAAAAAAGEGNNKGEEWWNKNEFSEAESSRTSSTNSSSSSGSSSSKSGSRSRGR